MNITERDELPDFDDLDKLIIGIRDLSLKVEMLDIHIKANEAEIIREYTTNPLRFVNGKAVSMTQLASTVAYTGTEGELVEMRKDLGSMKANLAAAKLSFSLEKAKIDIWRTRSANERLAMS